MTDNYYDLTRAPIGGPRTIGGRTYQIFEAITAKGKFQGYVIQMKSDLGTRYFPESFKGAAETTQELVRFLDHLEAQLK